MGHSAISEADLRRVISYSRKWQPEFAFDFDTARSGAIIAALEAEGDFVVEPERRCYGSGTASYQDVFLYYDDRIAEETGANGLLRLKVQGVRLYVCELYPVATWSGSQSERSPSEPGQSVSGMPNRDCLFLSPADLLRAPQGDWSDMVGTIDSVLADHGVSILGSNELDEPLPFDAEVHSFLPDCTEGRDPELKVFDALFYWAD